MKSPLPALLLCLANFALAAGGGSANSIKVWVNPLAGWNSPGEAWGAGLNVSRGKLMAGTRYVFATEFCVACDDWALMNQGHLLAGGKFEARAGFFDLLSGVSWETGATRDRLGRHHYQGFGLPLIAEGHLTLKYIGVGVSLAANVNADNPSMGAFLSLPVGLIR